MQILVKTLQGNKKTFIGVQLTDCVESLKAKIFASIGIYPIEQRIVFEEKQLQEGKLLSDYKIQENSVLYIVPYLRGGMKVFVRILRGELVFVELGSFDTSSDIKAKIQQKMGIPPDQQCFSFAGREIVGDKIIERWIEDGKTITIVAGPDLLIGNFKNTIQHKEGIPSNLQHLIFDGKKLEDGKYFSDFNIQPFSTIHLILQPQDGIKIFVRTIKGKLVDVELEMFDTNEHIKTKIQEKVSPTRIFLLLEERYKTVKL